jgi:hypothetical protein
MQINASMERALDYISQRADDVMHAYTPGAVPKFDDVATERSLKQPSFDPLCVAMPEGTYLLAAGTRGRTLYGRDGALHFEGATLTGEDGRPVLGFSKGGAALGPIQIDPVDQALGRARNLRIATNGSVAYDRDLIDPLTGLRHVERVSLGRIALARFPAATKLNVVDAVHGEAPAGVVPHVGVPGDGNLPLLSPMARASSRIDVDRSLERLQGAYVAFDAVEAAHKVQGVVGKTTMDLLK